jgi:hypothetical protein
VIIKWNLTFLFRLGLIRARLAGARLAKGDTLVFLDAHCECVVQWLEPLLQRIKEKETSVLVPIIDVIEAKNFYYSTNGYESFQVILIHVLLIFYNKIWVAGFISAFDSALYFP